MMAYDYWPPYETAAQRRAKVERQVQKLRKKGGELKPILIKGRKIAHSFWGQAWCKHLESFSDYENRLPRGRSYVRDGAVCHLEITSGRVKAMVAGTSIYKVTIAIEPLSIKKWQKIKSDCSGRIASLLELLSGKLSKEIMAVVTDRKEGLFPHPCEIAMDCSCPDWAVMCKHVAAVLYGVGSRLDEDPGLLFLLRGVDQEELVSAQLERAVNTSVGAGEDGKGPSGHKRLSADSVSAVFGIDLADEVPSPGAALDHCDVPAGEVAPVPKAASGRKAIKKGKAVPKRKVVRKTGIVNSITQGLISGTDVTELRKKLGMTQAEFALLIGVTPQSLMNWEKKPSGLSLRWSSVLAIQHIQKISRSAAWKRLQSLKESGN